MNCSITGMLRARDSVGLTSATHTYNYLQSDVTGNEALYVGARYFNNIWTNLGAGVMNTGANTITLTQNYIDGEYTCGEPPNFLIKAGLLQL